MGSVGLGRPCCRFDVDGAQILPELGTAFLEFAEVNGVEVQAPPFSHPFRRCCDDAGQGG